MIRPATGPRIGRRCLRALRTEPVRRKAVGLLGPPTPRGRGARTPRPPRTPRTPGTPGTQSPLWTAWVLGLPWTSGPSRARGAARVAGASGRSQVIVRRRGSAALARGARVLSLPAWAAQLGPERHRSAGRRTDAVALAAGGRRAPVAMRARDRAARPGLRARVAHALGGNPGGNARLAVVDGAHGRRIALGSLVVRWRGRTTSGVTSEPRRACASAADPNSR